MTIGVATEYLSCVVHAARFEYRRAAAYEYSSRSSAAAYLCLDIRRRSNLDGSCGRFKREKEAEGAVTCTEG